MADQNPNEEPLIKPTTRRPCRRVCICISFFTIAALTAWLVFYPVNPQFTVVNAAAFGQETPSPSKLSMIMSFTLAARNPNHKASIYYRNLTTSVLYRNEQISTPAITLPAFFQDKKSTSLISPAVYGIVTPVTFDLGNGGVWLKIEVLGRVRWKVELVRSIDTRYYALSVNCDVFVGLEKDAISPLYVLNSARCKVDIE